MNAAIEQELFELQCRRAAGRAAQRVVLEKAITEQPVAFKHTPGEQSPHVQRSHPRFLKDVFRKIKTEFGTGQPLSLLDEIRLMLEN